MTLVANLVVSASFCCGKFFKIVLRTILFCCRVIKFVEQMSVQNVLKNFTNFTGKNLCWSLFLINPEGLQLYLKEIQHKCFPVQLAIFMRTPECLKSQQHNLYISYWIYLVFLYTR